MAWPLTWSRCPPTPPSHVAQGIVKAGVLPTNITLIDQSPQQLDKARGKADLQGVTILEVMGQGAQPAQLPVNELALWLAARRLA